MESAVLYLWIRSANESCVMLLWTIDQLTPTAENAALTLATSALDAPYRSVAA